MKFNDTALGEYQGFYNSIFQVDAFFSTSLRTPDGINIYRNMSGFREVFQHQMIRPVPKFTTKVLKITHSSGTGLPEGPNMSILLNG